jgi:hypothetical protein
MYEDCLKTLQTNLNDQIRTQSFTNKNTDSNKSIELQRTIKAVCELVENDETLLNSIMKETQAIAESSSKKNLFQNVLLSAGSGRVEKVNNLSCELTNRVQMITALMMKDVWRASNGVDSVIMEAITDVEGQMFWLGQFASERQVSFGLFVDAYQAYLSTTFLFRKLDKHQLITLLRHTLLIETNSATDANSTALLLATEVSVTAFATWLNRYGPMKDTLTKACVVSDLCLGAAVPWFAKGMNRDNASRTLTNNLNKFSGGIEAQHLFVVRYSSDVKNHFVITTRPPGFQTIEHYPVVNTPLGYAVVGEKNDFQPTLLDCVQKHILDKLFNRANQSAAAVLSRESVEQWEALFASVTAELPADHYADVKALEKASAQLLLTESTSNVEKRGNATYGSLFGLSEPLSEIGVSVHASSSSSGSAWEKSTPADTTTSSVLNGATAVSAAYPVITSSPNTNIQNDAIGRYMVTHGVDLLRTSGGLSEEAAREILRLLNGGGVK